MTEIKIPRVGPGVTPGEALYALESAAFGREAPWADVHPASRGRYEDTAAGLLAAFGSARLDAAQEPQPAQAPALDDARAALQAISNTAELIFGDDAPPVSHVQLKCFAAAMGADARKGLAAIDAQQPPIEPHAIRAEVDADNAKDKLIARRGAALRHIQAAYPAGTLAHDTARNALDRHHGQRAGSSEAPDEREPE